MYWIIAALVLFILEMFTGTFYLLIVSASLASAALASWLFQTTFNTNALITIAFSIMGIVFMRFWLRRQQTKTNLPIANMVDYGQVVILHKLLADNLWQVHYRGVIWQARFAYETDAKSGDNAYIIGQKGNILLIDMENLVTSEEMKVV